MKKKILHIISSLKIGGAESVLFQLLKHMDTERFENEVICFHPGPNKEKIESLGIKVHVIKGLISLYDPLFLFQLRRLIKKINPDCIHSSLWAANLLSSIIGKDLKVPVISALHLGVDKKSQSTVGKFRMFLDSFFVDFPNRVIAVSQEVKLFHFKKFKIDSEKIIVVKNGVNLPEKSTIKSLRSSMRATLGLTDNDFIIGSVGRLVPGKNFSFLISVFAEFVEKNKNSKLIILGDGPEMQRLQELVQKTQLQGNVLLMGDQEASLFYPAFDCFVMTSFQEGLSMALLEAMSYGLPTCIACSDSDHDVIVHKNNGFLFPVDGKTELIELLQQIMSDVDFKIGDQARRTILEKFGVSSMARSYETIFDQVI
ncbi:MAG: Glycosyl transferase group 1 [candidate division TM6 bacterium GW2011_GWF2_32_72]|nr:MAG: Glycosyl transferase group 1 [candidate division TM6 bacterium GW2011_GWF2_32_72]